MCISGLPPVKSINSISSMKNDSPSQQSFKQRLLNQEKEEITLDDLPLTESEEEEVNRIAARVMEAHRTKNKEYICEKNLKPNVIRGLQQRQYGVIECNDGTYMIKWGGKY